MGKINSLINGTIIITDTTIVIDTLTLNDNDNNNAKLLYQ